MSNTKIKHAPLSKEKQLITEREVADIIIPNIKRQLKYLYISDSDIDKMFNTKTSNDDKVKPKKSDTWDVNGITKKITRISQPLKSKFGFRLYFYFNVHGELKAVKEMLSKFIDTHNSKTNPRKEYDKFLIITNQSAIDNEDLYLYDMYFRPLIFYMYDILAIHTQIYVPSKYPLINEEDKYVFEIIRTCNPIHTTIYNKYRYQLPMIKYNDALAMYFLMSVGDIIVYTAISNKTLTINMRVVIPKGSKDK